MSEESERLTNKKLNYRIVGMDKEVFTIDSFKRKTQGENIEIVTVENTNSFQEKSFIEELIFYYNFMATPYSVTARRTVSKSSLRYHPSVKNQTRGTKFSHEPRHNERDIARGVDILALDTCSGFARLLTHVVAGRWGGGEGGGRSSG